MMLNVHNNHSFTSICMHATAYTSGWQSHKYKKQTKHCVDVLVLVENGSDGYFIAASFMSPEFEIVSTKTVQKKLGLADVVMSQAIRLSHKDRAVPAMLFDPEPNDNSNDQEEGMRSEGGREVAAAVLSRGGRKGAAMTKSGGGDKKRQKAQVIKREIEKGQEQETPQQGEKEGEEGREEEDGKNEEDMHMHMHMDCEEDEDEEEEEDEEAQSSRVVQMLPAMFASLREEDIMEL
jgi:hypothetical protein